MNLTLGADPELFVCDQTGQFLSAHPYLKGTKEEPERVLDGALQLDGVAAEFNIDPVESEDEWVAKLNSVMQTLRTRIKSFSEILDITATTSVEFPLQYFNKLPEEVKILGCDPDFCAYKKDIKEMTEEQASRPFRTGGGHVHLGWLEAGESISFNKMFELTKQCDYSLYIGSLMFDDDRKRRELYGAVGSFRPKEYGLEYRVLSNAWVRTEELQRWVYRTTQKAFNDWIQGNLYENQLDIQDLTKIAPVDAGGILDQLGIERPVIQ